MTRKELVEKADWAVDKLTLAAVDSPVRKVYREYWIDGWKACEEYIQEKMDKIHEEHEKKKQEWNTRTRYNTEEP